MRQVRCRTEGCERAGIVALVPDLPLARGVVARPPLFCAACGFAIPEAAPNRGTPAKRHPAREAAVHTPPETRTTRR